MRLTSATASEAVVAPGCRSGAWGGDAGLKQASIDALRAGLAGHPKVFYGVDLFLAPPGKDYFSAVYCAAYGTSDPAELEARSGLPVWVLKLVSGATQACEFYGVDGSQLAEPAVDLPRAALEAIPVGADLEAIARRHTIMMLDGCATLQDGAGSGLLPEQQALVRELSALHAADCGDAGAFRALRRRATSAADAANAGVAATVLTFVESVAWPIAGLSAELPVIVNNAHLELRTHLAPQRATDEELAAIDAMRAAYEAIRGRQETEPGLDANAVHERWVATPEYMKVNAPEFQSRLRHYGRVAAETYAPFAVGLLLEAFGKA